MCIRSYDTKEVVDRSKDTRQALEAAEIYIEQFPASEDIKKIEKRRKKEQKQMEQPKKRSIEETRFNKAIKKASPRFQSKNKKEE